GGGRALDGEQTGGRPQIDDVSSPVLERGADPVGVGGVGHHPVVVLFPSPHDDVVDDAAVVVEQHRVVGATRLVLGDVVGEEVAQDLGAVRTGDLQPPEVGDVEHPHALADGTMLLEDGLVLHRHLPAAEVDEAGAEADVEVVERRPGHPALEPRSSSRVTTGFPGMRVGGGSASRWSGWSSPYFTTSWM